MPYAPRIRKDILKALNDHIIPALQSQKVLQVRAEAPFDFAGASYWIEQKELLPDRPHAHLQRLRRWENHNMISVNYPSFGFAYEGTAYERIGITASMAEVAKETTKSIAGITTVRIPAPGIVCYPAYCPHSGGSPLNVKTCNALQENVKVLAFHLIGDEVLPFTSVRRWNGKTENESSHHLQVSDAMLANLGRIYLDELRQFDNTQNAQSQLLIFMCRLKRYLQNNKPVISNSCWIKPHQGLLEQKSTNKHTELCDGVQNYIQTFLSQQLFLQSIAREFQVSPEHLNRVFREVHGVTLMRYVTATRIDVAKRILMDTPERISDVAELTGFSSAASFSTVFHKMTGYSPRSYRRQHNDDG